MPAEERRPFVPDDFVVPTELSVEGFRLVPLGPQHNEADHAAWMSSIEHIRATPGFVDRDWPQPMSLEQNRTDLVRHADDFAARIGFTYTVMDDAGAVIGCVYIYPPQDPAPDGADADVRSWVSAAHADRDADLYRVVSSWLADAWPFRRVRYAPRAADR
jgi:hypothetical protein